MFGRRYTTDNSRGEQYREYRDGSEKYADVCSRRLDFVLTLPRRHVYQCFIVFSVGNRFLGGNSVYTFDRRAS